MALRIGVDTGGTFTDICLYDTTRDELRVFKVSSTPEDPGKAIIEGVAELLRTAGSGEFSDVSYFAHGTTVGTNALLTETGARTGLLTTRGFRDLLELARGRRPKLYDLQADKPTPLVPRGLRHEVTERVRHDGTVWTPLDESEVRQAIRQLRDEGVEAIAVCLLYSYVFPDHERRIAGWVEEEFPGAYVSLSSEVLPEFREYERLSTVVSNAYLGPKVSGYLARLRKKLAERGLVTQPYVTQSNGGVVSFAEAEKYPVRMVLSGPSTGVVGAARTANGAGYPDIITFDMGGTSTDVSLVQHGEPKTSSGLDLDGRAIRTAMLDIHTVGAGGGSVARLDSGGLLKVGPESAGAFPGPACYGHGELPTVTDANVVLQVLNPDYFLGGRITIDREASRRAVGTLAEKLGMSVEDTAQGIIRVVTANMARAIRVISVQRGYDPRDYVMVPFGGAGPLHASRLAAELGMRTILVPESPGALSALGLLLTDIKSDFSRTSVMTVTTGAADDIAAVFAELSAQAERWFESSDIEERARGSRRQVDLRYAGQNHELTVDFPAGPVTAAAVTALLDGFALAHERTYGYANPGNPIQAVTFRVQASGEIGARPTSSPVVTGRPDGEQARKRPVYLPELGGFHECLIHDRAALAPGTVVEGPAIVEQMDTTTLVLPGSTAEVDAHRNLVIHL
ncbi:hydantoinase/oxoprolinase family protein [Nonomuraea sp. NEAU-A123]|uniref:hydantoinase/oxoprolinase family protein n=1 Tax=Nonomuraea sp. NEAU-A123 TaxID=2839649 RepID=UPI001BE4B05D|nr:hydantoinase/oxoprolinase family protein [Nonomuraea sp. NEAU-A123]MBT2233299.1 hydantoinase/oxoprolinase family protein [Nonomuraea sp. NEAU-A123]